MKWLQLIGGLGLAGLCIYAAFKDVAWDPFLAQMTILHWPWVILSVSGIIGCQIFRAARWKRLLKPIAQVSLKQSFCSYAEGNLLNMVIPLRGGDILRAWVLGEFVPDQRRASILATIVTERLVDLITFGLLLGSMLWIYPVPTWLTTTAGFLCLGSLLLGSLLIFLNAYPSCVKAIERLFFGIFSQNWAFKLSHILREFLAGVAPLKTSRDYGLFLLETILIWGCQGIFLFLLMEAFDFPNQYGLGFSSTLLMLALTTVAISLPSSPSYAGTLHLMAALSLEMEGVTPVAALSYAVLLHGLNTGITFALGIYGWRHLPFKNLSWNDLKRKLIKP